MTLQEITPENVLSQQHLDWLRHPVTIQALKNIDIFEKHLITKITNAAYSVDISDSTVRAYAVSLSNTRAIKSFLSITESFTQVSQNKIK